MLTWTAFRRIFPALVAGVFLLVFAPPALCAGDKDKGDKAEDKAKGDKEDKEDKGAGAKELIPLLNGLRALCGKEKELLGAWVKSAEENKAARRLDLIVLLDRPEQGKRLEKEAAALLAADPKWTERFSGGVSTARRRVFPVRSKYLKQLQRDLAAGELPGKAEDKVILRRTRFDDVRYNAAGNLAFEGVSLMAKTVADDKVKEPDVPTLLKDSILKWFEKKKLEAEYQIKGEKPFNLLPSVEGVKPLESPIFDWQRRLTDDKVRLDGALLWDVRYDADGTLLVEGFADLKETERRVDKFLNKQFATHPAVHKGKGGAKAQLELADWEVGAGRLQKAFADSKDRLVRQTRIDRSYFWYTPTNTLELHLKGVCCHEKDPPTDKLDRAVMFARLATACVEAAPTQRKLFGGRVNAAGVDLLTQPAYKLQGLAVQKELDMVVTSSRYDASGNLVLEGFVGEANPKQTLQTLHDFFAKKLGKHPALRPGKGPAWSLDEMKPVEWTVSAAQLQKAFAASDAPILRQSRLDRTFFLYSPTHALELYLEGVSLYDPLLTDKGARDDLLVRAGAICEETASKELARLFYKKVNSAKIVALLQPRARLQRAVAAKPALDGVRIDGTCYFDSKGRLTLSGIWRGEQQRDKLEEVVRDLYKGKPHGLTARPLSFDMKTVDIKKILLALRRWSAKHLEDVWVERLYFNSAGQLRYDGFGPAAGGDAPKGTPLPEEKQVTEELRRLVQAHPQRELLEGPPAPKGEKLPAPKEDEPEPPKKAAAPDWSPEAALVTLTAFLVQKAPDDKLMLEPRPSLARKLRELTQGNPRPKWAGVLIERGYPNIDRKYVVTGLVDNEDQLRALGRLLDELADSEEWDPLLPKPVGPREKPWRLEMKVRSLKQLLAELGEVLPDYVELNGIRLAGAYHDVKGQLVLTGYKVKGVAVGDPTKFLKDILDEDPVGRRRSAAKVEMPGVKVQLKELKRDEAVAGLAVQRALDLIRDNAPDSGHGPDMGCALPDGATRYGRSADERVPAMVPPYREQRGQFVGSLRKDVAATASAYLNTALMHTPDDGAAWFARGMTNMSRGRLVLATRDLGRVADLENGLPFAREARLIKLEPLQGTLRTVTNDYLDHVSVQVGAGQPHLTLAQVRAELYFPTTAARPLSGKARGGSLAARGGPVAR